MTWTPDPTTFTRPTEFLLAEHRVIERVLAAFTTMMDRAVATDAGAAGDALVREDVDDAIRFFRVFADWAHHAKEEELLFPALEAAGLPPRAGPTSVMRQEHELGRRLMGRLDDLAEAACSGPGPSRDHFVTTGREFVDMLRSHIAKEDRILFPMADQMLGPGVQASLAAAFRNLERDEEEEQEHARQLTVAKRLWDTYGGELPDAGEAVDACNGGCAHLHA